MNQAREILSHTWQHIQGFLFPMIRDELVERTAQPGRLFQWVRIPSRQGNHRVASIERALDPQLTISFNVN